MLAAVAKRAKLAFFDDPYRSLASNSNKSKKKNIKKPTVSASVHSKLWMTMSWNARPLGERETMFFFGKTENQNLYDWSTYLTYPPSGNKGLIRPY